MYIHPHDISSGYGKALLLWNRKLKKKIPLPANWLPVQFFFHLPWNIAFMKCYIVMVIKLLKCILATRTSRLDWVWLPTVLWHTGLLPELPGGRIKSCMYGTMLLRDSKTQTVFIREGNIKLRLWETRINSTFQHYYTLWIIVNMPIWLYREGENTNQSKGWNLWTIVEQLECRGV